MVEAATVVLEHTVFAIKDKARVTLRALMAPSGTVSRNGRQDTVPMTGLCTDAIEALGWTSQAAGG